MSNGSRDRRRVAFAVRFKGAFTRRDSGRAVRDVWRERRTSSRWHHESVNRKTVDNAVTSKSRRVEKDYRRVFRVDVKQQNLIAGATFVLLLSYANRLVGLPSVRECSHRARDTSQDEQARPRREFNSQRARLALRGRTFNKRVHQDSVSASISSLITLSITTAGRSRRPPSYFVIEAVGASATSVRRLRTFVLLIGRRRFCSWKVFDSSQVEALSAFLGGHIKSSVLVVVTSSVTTVVSGSRHVLDHREGLRFETTEGSGRTFGRPMKKLAAALIPLSFQIGAASTWAVVAALVGLKTLGVAILILKLLLIAGAAKVEQTSDTSRLAPPPMDTSNVREVIGASAASWIGTGYLMERGLMEGNRVGSLFSKFGHQHHDTPPQKEVHLHIHNSPHGAHEPYGDWSRDGAAVQVDGATSQIQNPFNPGPATINTPYGSYLRIGPPAGVQKR